MIPGNLPDDVTRRAVHADGMHVIWRLADAPDVVDACEERGVLLRTASVVHRRGRRIMAPAGDGPWFTESRPAVLPGGWPERVSRAAEDARALLARSRPSTATLDADGDSALFVARLIDGPDRGLTPFPSVLLWVLLGAPVLWMTFVLTATLLDIRRVVPARVGLVAMGSVVGTAVLGLIVAFVAGLLARRARDHAERLGAPLRLGGGAAHARMFVRVGILTAAFHGWGMILGIAITALLIGTAPVPAVLVVILVLAVPVVSGVAAWRRVHLV